MSENSQIRSEREFRRNDFDGGIPVVLADDQEWFLAEPKIRFRPANTEVGFEEFLWVDDDGVFQKLVQQHDDMLLLDAEDMVGRTEEWIACEIKMGRAMLERNYHLSLDQLQRILHFNYEPKSDPVATGIRNAVLGILGGNTPKPSAGGDVPSLTSSAR